MRRTENGQTLTETETQPIPVVEGNTIRHRPRRQTRATGTGPTIQAATDLLPAGGGSGIGQSGITPSRKSDIVRAASGTEFTVGRLHSADTDRNRPSSTSLDHGFLSIPQWPAKLPHIIEQEIIPDPARFAQESSQAIRPVDYDMAKIAEVLIEKGILNPRTWADNLSRTIMRGLAQWLNDQGLNYNRTYQNSPLWYLNIVMTDDVEFGMGLSGYNPAGEWWKKFGTPSTEFRRVGKYAEVHTPPIGAFAMTTSAKVHVMKMKTWGARLKHEFGETIAGDIFGALNSGLEAINCLTLSWAEDRVICDYEVLDLDDDEPKLTREVFHKHVPEYATQSKFNTDRLRRCAERSEGCGWRIAIVVRAAYQLAKVLDELSDDYHRRKSLFPNYDCDDNHRDFFYCCVPPLSLYWSGKVGVDPCVRLIDDHMQMVNNTENNDVCWLHGFDVDKSGGEDMPGTIESAIAALHRHARLMVPLYDLVKYLSYSSPRVLKPEVLVTTNPVRVRV